MANFSAEFLEVDDFDKTPNLHRSRSGGYVDYLEEQARWDRRDRERQMKRYHDSRYSPQPAPPSDRLYVPAFDTTHRRVRSQDFTEKKEEPAQRYNVREARPQRTYETNAEPPRPTELPIRQKPQRKPTVKVQIHQADPPAPASEKTPKKNLSASPRSPTAVPEVQFRYSTLQHKLGQIETTCSPFVDVEAANPRDLTFAKISEQVKSFAFELESWNYIVRVEDMARIDMGKRHIVEAASRTLGRLIERVTELSSACGKAKPRDLKLEPIPYVDSSDEDFKSDEDDHDDGYVRFQSESRREADWKQIGEGCH